MDNEARSPSAELRLIATQIGRFTTLVEALALKYVFYSIPPFMRQIYGIKFITLFGGQ